MDSIVIGSLLISLLHAVIPSHWLPLLAIGRKEQWSLKVTEQVTFVAGLAHVLSTIVIGIILGIIGQQLSKHIEYFTHLIAPCALILIGLYYIRQHYTHHHFHLQKQEVAGKSKNKIIAVLVLAMFFSPCMEIEAYFLLAGAKGWWLMGLIALV